MKCHPKCHPISSKASKSGSKAGHPTKSIPINTAGNKTEGNTESNRENNTESRLSRVITRFPIWLTALFMMLLLTACGSGAADSGRQVWIPEFRTIEMTENSYNNMAILGDTFYYISYEQQGEGFRYRLSGYSLTDGPLPPVPLNWPDQRDRFLTSLFAMDQEGGVYVITFVTAEGGSETHLCKFDTKGNLLYDTDISGETGDINLLAADSRGRIYISGNASGASCIWLYTAEGTCLGTFTPDLPTGRITALGPGRDGAMYACCQSNNGGGTDSFLMEIDFDKAKAGALLADFPRGDNSLLIPGPENTLLSFDRTTLYSYDLTTQKSEILFDWLDYGINGSHVTAVHMQDDGQLLAVNSNLAEKNIELALLKKSRGTQIPERETIVLGTLYSNTLLRNAVMEFNRENEKYQVKIREYLDPQTHDRGDAALRLNNDILSDNCPDLLDTAELDLNALASKGLFADLNPYLESSTLLNASDFLDNLLEAYTIDNKLVTIPSCFSLRTVFGQSTETGQNWGWTLEELIAYANAHPEAEIFDNTSRSEIMQYLMSYNMDTFIDWSSGECRFDSDAFRELLQFVSRFPGETVQNPQQASTPVRIRNGEVLLLAETLTDFNSIQLPLAIYENGANCIGFPSGDGSAGCMLLPYGAYGITVSSERKEGAWAFLEKFLTSGDRDSAFFPSQKTRLEEKAAYALKPEALIDENGNPLPNSTDLVSIGYADWEYTYHIPTQEEVALTLDLIAAAKPVSFSETNEVVTIVNEEAEAYYLGQKTLDQVVEIIQSRIRIYVNED